MKQLEGQGVTTRDAMGVGVNKSTNTWQSCLPDCLFMALELEARDKFAIANMDRLFGEHSYHFDCKQKQGLDIIFSRYEDKQYFRFEQETISGYLGDKLQALYGLQVSALSFPDRNALDQYLFTMLAKNERVICEYSGKYVPYRVEDYHKYYGYHIVTFKSYDKAHNAFMVDDALKRDVSISWQDYQSSFEDVLAHEGSVRVYHIKKVGTESPLTLEWALKQVEQNIAGLVSDSPHIGTSAISEFLEYISCLNEIERPFVIPGVWVFSLQRASALNWLMALQQDFSDPKLKRICAPMIEALPDLSKGWKEVELLMRLSCRSKSVTGHQVYQRILHLCEVEQALIQVWLDLQEWLLAKRRAS
ncbi:hypothetical protein N474_07970 [Pseudoalteromonas luteoviolacea CPMOR-2]|uniref:Butirosin biosynthesis protein H N-terminal domain-containing protein n=1 Tax=Pseudoalteromonas luteoviolacea DSM 6061 TaxID=1365250 RepID=A0A166YT66_9GAMM|nr:hypothetical protein [Pseudoalteromonas luteoviolacea]KZN43496.1 hypothetical protein N475_08825 [Pseudoalteromonas luteoviolacea DSM 6061]KZN57336.1 hypothetical protein N474_07970 [Pseudoalteromonas luteoviolacea CPMOR-2]MBE0388074.1 hypothetical protein [Pseudoalteromonas luteoviolacea DSM 6061]